MSTESQNANSLNPWVVVALFCIILWYWLPHFMTENKPEDNQSAGPITVLPVKPLVEEPPAPPEEASTESESEKALAESQPEPSPADLAPPGTQASAQPVSASAVSSEGTAIAGRVQDIWSLVDWLQQRGGKMWLDDGYQTLGRIYELDRNGLMAPVSKQQYQDAGSQYAPRSMSQVNHRQVAQSLAYAVDSKRLLLMWPKPIWLDIQNRINRLGVDQIQLEYHIVGGELELHVVEALRQGVPAPELQGLLH